MVSARLHSFMTSFNQCQSLRRSVPEQRRNFSLSRRHFHCRMNEGNLFSSIWTELCDIDASPERRKKEDKHHKHCLDVHLSVKSDCAWEMFATSFHSTEGKNNKIDNLLVFLTATDWKWKIRCCSGETNGFKELLVSMPARN